MCKNSMFQKTYHIFHLLGSKECFFWCSESCHMWLQLQCFCWHGSKGNEEVSFSTTKKHFFIDHRSKNSANLMKEKQTKQKTNPLMASVWLSKTNPLLCQQAVLLIKFPLFRLQVARERYCFPSVFAV